MWRRAWQHAGAGAGAVTMGWGTTAWLPIPWLLRRGLAGFTGGDPHAILGVRPGCSTKTLKAAYRKLALELHPDTAANPTAATELLKRVNVAYEAAVAQRANLAAHRSAASTGPPPPFPSHSVLPSLSLFRLFVLWLSGSH